MATKSADRTKFIGNSYGLKTIIINSWREITKLFDMPPNDSPTLPEELLARMGRLPWSVASLLVGIVFYILFLLGAYADGFAVVMLNSRESWKISLVPPIMLVYLLLAIPILQHLLSRAIEVFRSMVPRNDRFNRLEIEAYSLNRRREWVAAGLGTLVGWVMLKSLLNLPYPSVLIYDLIGDVLIFGLAGWHIYAALSRTKLLTKMHGQVQDLNIFKQPAPFTPIVEWTLGVMGVLIGGIVIIVLLVPSKDLFNQNSLIVASVLSFSAILVFVFSKAPASLLGQLRVVRALILFLMVAIIGTIGFNQLEPWNLYEAFYATIITMTTIGYGDFSPQSFSGRLFAIVLSLFAIGIGGYAITSVASFVIEGNLHRFIQGKKVDKQIVKMNNHYILCGTGQVGKQIAIEFYKTQVPFVVIERDPLVLEELLREIDIPYVQGDATQDEALHLAGVKRAKGLIAALSDDKDNVFIVLSAYSLNPDLRIISRMNLEKNRNKLEKAGADTIISPNGVSGRRMVAEMLHSEVVTLLDEMLRAEQQTGQILRLEELYVDEIKVPVLVERLNTGELSITDIGQRTELMVVAVKREHQEGGDPYIYTPRGNTKLQHGDVLIVIATPEQRVKLYNEVLSQSSFEIWLSNIWG